MWGRGNMCACNAKKKMEKEPNKLWKEGDLMLIVVCKYGIFGSTRKCNAIIDVTQSRTIMYTCSREMK